jgi:hypothetical protein
MDVPIPPPPPPPNIFTDRPNVNSLFGAFSVSRTSIAVNATGITDDSVYDYILRDPGIRELQRDIEMAEINMNIKFAPEEYINEKNRHLQAISTNLRIYFRDKLTLYMKHGFSQNEAMKKATEATNKERELLMILHKRKFKKEVDQLNPRFL